MRNWMMRTEKEVYKLYTVIMGLVITFQIGLLLWQRTLASGIVLGFNIGLWVGFSLRRLVPK